MKKGFLFGFGVLLAGSLLAASISTISIGSKLPSGSVTNEEFNLITSGLGNLSSAFDGTTSTETSILVPKDIISTTNVSAPEICIDSDCKTAWPSGGTVDNMGNHSATQSILPSINNSFDIGSSTSKFAKIYAQAVCINNDCQTSWPAGGSGVSDQTCDTGYVVKGITGGDFECVLDANDGSGESPIDDMQPARWCWSPDGISIDCDREAPGSSSTSVDYQYWQCLPDGKTYWYTSTGVNMAIVKEDCTSLGGCINEEIGGTCINSTSGGTSITPLTCGAGEHLYKANSDGTFVCSADTGSGGTSVWVEAPPTATSGDPIIYSSGNVGIGVTSPIEDLDVSAAGSTILTQKLCLTDGTDTSLSQYEVIEGNIKTNTSKDSLCVDRESFRKLASLYDMKIKDTTTLSKSPCTAENMGKFRVVGPLSGGALYKLQVCFLQASEYGWFTLLNSDSGLPPGETVLPAEEAFAF